MPRAAQTRKQHPIDDLWNATMPNGKPLHQCTFAEISEAFTIKQLREIYPNMNFWLSLAAGEGADERDIKGISNERKA